MGYVWKLRWPPKNWMAPCTKMNQFQGKIMVMGWVPKFEVNTHGYGILQLAGGGTSVCSCCGDQIVYHCFWWYLNVFVFFYQVCGGICQYPWLPGLHPCMTTFATNQKSLQKIQRIVGERIDGATLAATPILGGFSQRAMMFTTTGAMGVASAMDPFQVVVSAIEGIDSLLIATTKFHAMDNICRSWDAKPQPPRWQGQKKSPNHFPISGFPKIVGFPPKSSILIGFSIKKTIHFGVPLFLETP